LAVKASIIPSPMDCIGRKFSDRAAFGGFACWIPTVPAYLFGMMRLVPTLVSLAASALAFGTLTGCVSASGWRSFDAAQAQKAVLADVPIGTPADRVRKIAASQGFSCRDDRDRSLLYCDSRGHSEGPHPGVFYRWIVGFSLKNDTVTSISTTYLPAEP
jgi:hypothetical protein